MHRLSLRMRLPAPAQVGQRQRLDPAAHGAGRRQRQPGLAAAAEHLGDDLRRGAPLCREVGFLDDPAQCRFAPGRDARAATAATGAAWQQGGQRAVRLAASAQQRVGLPLRQTERGGCGPDQVARLAVARGQRAYDIRPALRFGPGSLGYERKVGLGRPRLQRDAADFGKAAAAAAGFG